MANSGYKSFETLELYYTDGDKSYAGQRKPNVITDPDYIAPVLDTVSCAPGVRYYNTEKSVYATRNNCPINYKGSSVKVTAYPNQFASDISVADANNKALAWLAANAQSFANSSGSCIFSPGPVILPVNKSTIFENQDSIWDVCRGASSADFQYTSNQVIGAGKSGSLFYLNRYRGAIDTSSVTTKPKSAKLKFKFSTNTVGRALTFNLYAATTKIPISQAFQLSDWNDWNSDSFVNKVEVSKDSTNYQEIALTPAQLNLLLSDQVYNFFLISNGDKDNSTPTTNNRPVLAITPGSIYMECTF
jgi:hypothetical protein